MRMGKLARRRLEFETSLHTGKPQEKIETRKEGSKFETWKQPHKRNKALEGNCYHNLEPQHPLRGYVIYIRGATDLEKSVVCRGDLRGGHRKGSTS